MTVTPLTMTGYSINIGNVTFVIQWHVLAMFGTAFLTGAIIHRFGVAWIMLSGAALLAFAVATALAGGKHRRQGRDSLIFSFVSKN